MQKQVKARYWCAVLYPENMIPDWEIKIGDLIEFPYAYCVHDKDVDKEGNIRKTHMHIIIAYSNTTTQSAVVKLLEKLNARGKNAFNAIQQVGNIRHMYNYLIHDTETCKKRGKHLYETSERITGNNFDIGDFEQVSTADKRRMLKEICDAMIDNEITNMAIAYKYITENYDDAYFDVLATYSGMISRIVKGLYLQKLAQNNLKS